MTAYEASPLWLQASFLFALVYIISIGICVWYVISHKLEDEDFPPSTVFLPIINTIAAIVIIIKIIISGIEGLIKLIRQL